MSPWGPSHNADAARVGAEACVVAWIEAHVGGRVVRVERLGRWRAGWFIDVASDEGMVELYVRGARGPDFPSPYDLAHEVRVHEFLEAHHVPVPHVYGIVITDEGEAMVMARVPGVQGLASEPDQAARQRVLFTCIDHLARLHAIGPQVLADHGFAVPRDPETIVWSGVIAELERNYLAMVAEGHQPDAVIEFLRRWLRRNMPAGRTRPAFVTWDAAQFLHHDGVLTALIDFELAHVGDPYMDLAPLRSRDTMEPFGDLAAAFARYEQATGAPIDFDVVRYFEIAQLTATLLLQWPVLQRPHRSSDLMTHIVWFIESARYAFDVWAELSHCALDDAVIPEVALTSSASVAARERAHEHLVANLHALARRAPTDDSPMSFVRWQARAAYRVARHLQRVDIAGDAIDAADETDLLAVLASTGEHVASGDAEAALLARIEREEPGDDAVLAQFLNRRMQRQSALVGPPGARSAQHVPLQPLPR